MLDKSSIRRRDSVIRTSLALQQPPPIQPLKQIKEVESDEDEDEALLDESMHSKISKLSTANLNALNDILQDKDTSSVCHTPNPKLISPGVVPAKPKLSLITTDLELSEPFTPVSKKNALSELLQCDSPFGTESGRKDQHSSECLLTNTSRKLIPDAILSPQAESMSKHSSVNNEDEIATGIVDYIVLLGPVCPYSLACTHEFKDGVYHRLPKQRDNSAITPVSPISSTRPTTESDFELGLAISEGHINGSPGSAWVPGEEMTITLLDRLPTTDLRDLEMPSKLEWFACPEGSITVLAAER